MNTQNKTAQVQPEPQIIIKGEEVGQLEKLLDEFPHGVAKKLIALVNKSQQARSIEQLNEAAKEQQNKELEELRKFKKLFEAAKSAKIISDGTKVSEPSGTPGGECLP